MMKHAEFFQTLIGGGARDTRRHTHRAVNPRPLGTSAAQRFPPRRQRHDWLVGAEPGVTFLERNLINVRFEKTCPAEVIRCFIYGQTRTDLAQSAQEINLPTKRCPTESSSRALDRLCEIAPLVCRSRETHFIFDADRARQRFFVAGCKDPRNAGRKKGEPEKAKHNRNYDAAAQFRRAPDSEA